MQTHFRSWLFSRPVVTLVTLLLAALLVVALTGAIVPGAPLGGGSDSITGFVP